MKMCTRHITYLVILLVTMTNVLALQCPTNKECHCKLYKLNKFNSFWAADINCTMDNNSVFNIFIKEGLSYYIKITCINSSYLSDLNLDIRNIMFYRRNENEIEFEDCNLSKNIKLIDIVEVKEAKSANKLRFISYKKLNLTLEKCHLNGFENLEELEVTNYNIFHMDEDLLSDLKELRFLALTNNTLEQPLPAKYIDNSAKLEKLFLINNNLRRIEPSTFDKLKNLTDLILKNNSLIELPSNIFDNLVALKILDISMNNLSSLPQDIFAKLENLHSLYLNGNNFIKLPRDLLRNNMKLKIVYLRHNQKNLTLLDGFFCNLMKLNTLTLTNNGLITLPEDLFWGSASLIMIKLNNNNLESLPKKIFWDSRMLIYLYLNSNNLEVLPDYIFTNTSQLRVLDLSNNRITFISNELFDGLKELEKLNMKRNHLRTVSDYSFSSLKSLRIINLSHNNLTLQSNWSNIYSPFFDCSSLMELYLANNSISKIFNDWIIHYRLYKLDLSYNSISSIKTEDLLFQSDFIMVNLTHNKIQHIFLHDAEYIINQKKRTCPFVQILMDNNPLNCDCDMYDFLRYKEGKMSDVRKHFEIKLENLTCRSPKELEKEEIYSTNLTCRVKNIDPVSVCPEKCDCFLKPHDKAFIFNCSHKNLTTIPNNIKEPNILFIQNLTKSIDTISQFYLNLSHNRLTQMPDLKKVELKSVNELSLSYNNISTISLNGLSTTLKVLELENNNLSRIHPNVLKFWKNSTNLTHLTLHKNPWECDCDATELSNFTRSSYQILPELSKIMCHRQKKSILEMTFNDFCPQFDATIIISTSVIIAFIGLIIGILGLYYKYQTHIKIWLFARQWCLWSITVEQLNEDKGTEYDAFVSFSRKDHDFIANELVPKLESGATPFKLCLHYRDWLDSKTLPANIVRSVGNSRRTMVVLSKNFLESDWGRFEFMVAHRQPLSEGRSRVILILYGDIGPTDNLDPELRAYISMNTYIQWGDPRFWDRLRYAIRRQSRRPICIPARRKVYCTLL